ncbi:MAG TPA: hypothetical protein VGX50_03620, partial [Longimicrobium sp.]|nr:hypothetical protein [Longimicrobium sp.]
GGVTLLVGACNFAADLLPHYTGPQPSRDPITNERVVVRQLVASSIHPNAPGAFYAERTRFVEAGDPHNVNRVVMAIGGDLHAQLAALNPRLGDTLLISTQYDTTYYDAVSPDAVPDWPGHAHFEYPIAWHTLTALAPAP